ncbi:Hypothetical Protein FCC1311_060462 [Hondaea fermentalgiana]|uniref:Uncharacterized protein n=1 Tax=Hondaea fermentalgiana TaxID=2315210 RepID=A0A2R5GFZ0_9STRA|nr:Hypothetical Protein FCC1311_060462 [Hondaea fermentalgiana]|eukprot:GBG29826.1 Hypothetical Protein FCC1311_060462 [Hondaea fermentalgiana]
MSRRVPSRSDSWTLVEVAATQNRGSADQHNSDDSNSYMKKNNNNEEDASTKHDELQGLDVESNRADAKRKKSVWSRDSTRSWHSGAGSRRPLDKVLHEQPHPLRHVHNLHNLRENITSLQRTGDNEIVFYPGEFDGELVWHTRHHRKNRFPMIEAHTDETFIQRTTLNLVNVEIDNVSWWVAHVFTWGSVLWVVNAVYLMWPVENEKENLIITAITAFFGGFVFEFGAYFAVLEAINPRRHLEFGYRVAHIGKSPIHGNSKQMLHLFPHVENERKNWRWFALEFGDTGKCAASVQFVGATFFLVAVTLALPNASASDILIPSTHFVVQDIFVWGFQVLGSLCFLYAGIILMRECQYAWYMPNLGSLGWHANFWNTIGALGFLFCAIFGFLDNVNGRTVCCQFYGTYLSTFWGSIGFLNGSILMVIEVANKHPYPTPSFLRVFTTPTAQAAEKKARREAAKARTEKTGADGALAKDSSSSSSASARRRVPVETAEATAKGEGKDLNCLRHVENLDKLPSKVSHLEQKGDNEVVFYPDDFDGELVYHSRHHRKNRFPMVNSKSSETYVQRHHLQLLSFDPENVSWWVAHTFTWGSVLFVVQGYYLLWPIEDDERSRVLTGVLGFIGGLLFEVGAYAAVLEAINPRPKLEFGYYVSDISYKNYRNVLHLVPHVETRRKNWNWFALKFDDAGQKAASVQFIGATFYLIATIMELPIYNAENTVIPSDRFILIDVFVYGFEVIGSVCFLYSPIVLMLETQYAWYMPNFGSLGWHISFWNMIGGWGFMLCAIFGFLDNVNGRTICCQFYGTDLSTFWGSIAFLLASILLAIEVANKHPLPTPSFLVPFTRPTKDKKTRSNRGAQRQNSLDKYKDTQNTSNPAAHSDGSDSTFAEKIA